MDVDDFSSVIASMRQDADALRVDLPSSWMQGRTAFGGASAAMGLAAVLSAEPDLAPFRSAQVAFVGPLGGTMKIRTSVLRKGRSAAFMGAEIFSNEALGLSATYLFASERESGAEHLPKRIPELPGRGDPIKVPADVAFAQNLDLARAGRPEGRDPAIRRWIRLKRRTNLPEAVELLLIADALPAAALKLFERPGPVSTMTWQLNLLTPTPCTMDGWWLVSAEAPLAQAGFSSQSMQVWNSSGEPIATAIQSVALFV